MGGSALPFPSRSSREGECLPNSKVTQVRNAMKRFPGHLCYLEHHHPLCAFQASSHSNEGVALGASRAPIHQSQGVSCLWVPTLGLAEFQVGTQEVCAHGASPRQYEKSGTRHSRHTEHASPLSCACCALPSHFTYKPQVQ